MGAVELVVGQRDEQPIMQSVAARQELPSCPAIRNVIYPLQLPLDVLIR